MISALLKLIYARIITKYTPKERNMSTNKKTTQENDNLVNDVEKEAIEGKADVETSKPVFADEAAEQEPQTNRQRFLNKFNLFGDLFVLNVYFFVTCLPIITIGASLTALYTVTNKLVRNEEGAIRTEYFKSFKSNFKQATIIWLIDIFCIIFLMFQLFYYQTHQNGMSKFLFIFMGMEFVIMAFEMPLQFPLLSRYENTVPMIMLNSLILALNNLGVWFRQFFIWLFPLALYYMKPTWLAYTWFLWGMVLTALLAYACSMFLRTFFDKIEAEDEERAEKRGKAQKTGAKSEEKTEEE